MRRRRVALAAVAVAGTAAAGRVALRRAATGIKDRTRSDLDWLYDLPGDVERHEIPSADGGSLHILERGKGRPLLLIHGITLQASVWSPQLHLLSDRYRVLAMDVRGHGRSQAGTGGFGRKAAARDVATVLEHFDVHGTVVVGHSMGGMILMEFAGDFPGELEARVAGLVFMDTAASQLLPRLALPAARMLGGRLRRRLESGRRVPHHRFGDDDLSWVTARLAFGRAPSGKAVGQVRRFVEEVPQATSLPSGVDLLDHDGRQALAATDTPSLVLVGSRDLLTPTFAARRIAQLLPHARLEVIAGAGHQLMQERPYEVAALLDAFVAGLPG